MAHRFHSLSLLIALAFASPGESFAAPDAAPASDTPETLAAMRAMLPPLPAEVPSWDSLPAEIRRDLADFRLGMHRWHADPAQRFVVVEGRRVEAGGVLGRELWLREVRPDSVVLQFREHIFWRSR